MTNRTALLYFLPRCMRWLEAMMCSLGGLVACGLLVNSKITVTPWEQTQIIFFFTPGTRLKVRKVSLLKLELSLPDSTDFITSDDFSGRTRRINE